MLITLNALILAAAITGFSTAYKIYKKKRKPGPFVCPLNFDCHAVTQSQYSKLMGIPLEILGVLYYLFIFCIYLSFLVFPEIKTVFLQNTALVATIAGFVFSIFLTFVQAVKIKQWCSWCLVSAVMCTVIFFAELGLLFLVQL